MRKSSFYFESVYSTCSNFVPRISTVKMPANSPALFNHSAGAANCEVDLVVPRQIIVGALSAAEIKVTLPDHTVNCEVEREGSIDKARITLAPIIEFKGGKAKKIWVNVTDIKAPGMIKGVVWSAAQLQDSVGIFHRRMVKSVNKFIAEQCPKVVAGG